MRREREREREGREREREERQQYKRDRDRDRDRDRGYRSSSARSSPYRERSKGEREKRGEREGEGRYLLYPSEDRFFSRDYHRGDGRREERRKGSYQYDSRKGGIPDRWKEREERRREERYPSGFRHSLSPRPLDYERRGGVKVGRERSEREERRAWEIASSIKTRRERERERGEKRQVPRKRKRSREELETRHRRGRGVGQELRSEGEESGRSGGVSLPDKIEDLIKELEEGVL